MAERILENVELCRARENGMLMSPTMVKGTDCMLWFMYHYIDKVVTKPTRALLMGSLFDHFCETNGHLLPYNDFKDLSTPDMDIVIKAFERYRPHIDYDNDAFQMLVWAHVAEGVYLHGYLDIVKQHTDIRPDFIGDDVNEPGYIGTCSYIIDKVIDTKFTLKKLKPSRTKKDGTPSYDAKEGWKQQGRHYIWLLQQMGYKHIDSIQFDVMNAEDDELIQIVYKPKQISVDNVRAEVIAAWLKIEHAKLHNDYVATVDWRCKWGDGPEEQCDYYETCSAQKLLAKAKQEQDAIMTDYNPELDG